MYFAWWPAAERVDPFPRHEVQLKFGAKAIFDCHGNGKSRQNSEILDADRLSPSIQTMQT
jgi:hypothetical protein